jgi:hypothetical protein
MLVDGDHDGFRACSTYEMEVSLSVVSIDLENFRAAPRGNTTILQTCRYLEGSEGNCPSVKAFGLKGVQLQNSLARSCLLVLPNSPFV